MLKNTFFILDWDMVYTFIPIVDELISRKVINQNVSCLTVGKFYHNQLINKSIKHPFTDISSLDEVYENNIYNYHSNKIKLRNNLEIIKKLEKVYAIDESLWKVVWADRNHIEDSYENIINMIVVFFDYFEKLYLNHKIDLIVTNAYASMPHIISCLIAKKQNIKIIAPEMFRIEKKTFWSISSGYKLLSSIENISSESKNAKIVIKNYRENFEKPFFEKINDKKRKNYLGGLKRLFRYSYRFYKGEYTGHTKPNPFKKLYNEELSIRFNRAYLNFKKELKYINIENMKQEKYIYFPLHMQPEATTMTNAHFYINQLFVAEILSKSVPMEYKIYIKEHPNMYGKNKISFYSFLKKLPNVELLHPSVNSKDLTRYSQMIFTITGTVGLEGLLLKKPVVTIGETFYNDCDLVYKLKDIPIMKWYDAIKIILNTHSHNEDILENFIAKVLMQSSSMIIHEPDYYDGMSKKDMDENLQNVVKSLITILND